MTTNNNEERREVKTFEVDYKCPKCGAGYLRPTGIAVGGEPIQYPHKCNNCDYREVMKGYKYPYLVYEPVSTLVYLQFGNSVDIAHGKDFYDNNEIHTNNINVVENTRPNEFQIEIPFDLKDKPMNEINNYVKKESGK